MVWNAERVKLEKIGNPIGSWVLSLRRARMVVSIQEEHWEYMKTNRSERMKHC